MTKVDFPSKPPADPPPDATIHRHGVCLCSKKHRNIVRKYLGYGLCGYCGKLTGYRLAGGRKG